MNVEIENIHYNRGKKAFNDGLPYGGCPYEKASGEWHLWTQGYSSAEFNAN